MAEVYEVVNDLAGSEVFVRRDDGVLRAGGEKKEKEHRKEGGGSEPEICIPFIPCSGSLWCSDLIERAESANGSQRPLDQSPRCSNNVTTPAASAAADITTLHASRESYQA